MLPSFRFPVHRGAVWGFALLASAAAAFGASQEAGGISCKMSIAQGHVEVRRAQVTAALERFEEALAGGGDCLPEAHLGLATAYNSKNDHKRALKAAETALSYAEDEEVLAEVHYQIGLAYDRRGTKMNKKKAQALAAFEQALELSDGEHAGAIRAVFRIAKETKDTERLAQLEARYPEVRVATRAEQRRAVRPTKRAEEPEPVLVDPANEAASVLATVGEGELYDCSNGQLIAPEEQQARFEEFADNTHHVEGDISKPEKIHVRHAQYPEEDRKAKIQGVVILQTIIDSEGSIRLAKILKGLSEGINRAAIDAICQWEFKPAELADGTPVAVFYNLTMNFRTQ